jgi:hypothetical protein
MHVLPISAAAVRDSGDAATFEGRSYRAFARGRPVIDYVVGELYWKAQVGDVAETVDFVAPPRILSCEKSDGEIQWSEGEYVPTSVLTRAFGLGALPRPQGVAPCQPNPHTLRGSALVFAVLAGLMLLSSLAFELGSDKRVIAEQQIAMPPSETAIKAGLLRPPPLFLPAFELPSGPSTLMMELESDLDNGWTSIGAALLNEATGEIAETELLAEHYHGVTDGESWSEGSSDATEYFGALPAGRYILRLTPSWEPWGTAATHLPIVRLRVVEGERSPGCCCGAWVLIALPFGLRAVRRAAFEARRSEHKTV